MMRGEGRSRRGADDEGEGRDAVEEGEDDEGGGRQWKIALCIFNLSPTTDVVCASHVSHPCGL